jgi:sensor histidine kinase YesM
MLKYYWDIPALLFCFYLMYLAFGNTFLNLQERYPFMEKLFTSVAAIIGGIIIICFYCIALEQYQVPVMIYSYVYISTLLPLLVVFIALARRSRHHPLVRFFLFGSLCFYMASFGSFLMLIRPLGLINALGEMSAPSLLIVAGVLLQSMFFLAGLSYRNKLVHHERTRTQELLIKQLNKNKELQRKLNEQLEELVKEQTTEILRKKQELEEQRKRHLEIEYDKKLTEIELKAIRAQINPHFIFNCLNSIQLFVMQRDFEYAQKYLSDFSYLIRKTLDFSRRNFISLADEIAYLNTYLGLEKMRFENKMEYEIYIDPAIATAELEVPAMLLQPYVENAVKYGMTNSDHPIGKLLIQFNQTAPDMLECLIEDNGIGIIRSKTLRTLPKHHQSSGMEISFNRAELLNKMYNTGIHIDIIDKSENNNTESGTIVRILIPQL